MPTTGLQVVTCCSYVALLHRLQLSGEGCTALRAVSCTGWHGFLYKGHQWHF